jgi:hypothetical protein
LYGGLDKEDFVQVQLLRAFGGEAAVSTEDDVDNVLWVLEILSPRLVTLIVILLILSLFILGKGWGIE